MRRPGGWLALVLLAALGAVAAVALASTPQPTASAPSVRVKLLTGSQHNALRLGYVRARVRSRRPGSVRVALRLGKRTLSKGRLVRFRKRGAKTVRLRLTKAGKKRLASCGAKRVTAAGRARARGSRKSRKLRRTSRSLRRDGRLCPRKQGSSPGGGGGPGGGRGQAGAPAPLGRIDTANASRCDFLDPALCLYPWPNDHFTAADSSTDTGRRLALDLQSMPSNRLSAPIQPTDINRADGFSPGNMIVTKVPGLETQAAFDKSGIVPITDMARYADPGQPVVVINARTRQRQMIWAEIDSNPADPSDVTLIVRPGKNFEEGERYIVALRRLRNAAGNLLGPREEFRAYRDGLKTRDAALESRRAHFEDIFKTLGQAGVGRSDLYLAWDFTVASERSLSERALSIRDDAFAQLGDTDLSDLTVDGTAPTFVPNPDINDDLADGISSLPLPDLPLPLPLSFNDLDGRRDFDPCGNDGCQEGESNTTARRITGQLTVPCYLNAPGCPPGSSFTLGSDGKPQRVPGNTTLANVICTIPRAAVDGANPAKSRPSLYGHGLLGDAGEVNGGNVQSMGQEHNMTFCATDWAGMSTTDVPNVVLLLQDLSNFNSLVDRIQQGYVNFLYLGRWMIHPQGASAQAGFQRTGGESVIDTRRLFYDGNSQGGILSGGLTALAPDFQRAVHGVPGMNYSTLLRRSVDFDMYANGDIEGTQIPIGLYDSYPDEFERPLILSLIQLLWDRGEANGYAQHMTSDPLPDTPPHQVLLHPAFGDHQVANVSAEVEARTIGARAYKPAGGALDPGRHWETQPLFGIPAVDFSSPYTGSALVYWDTGPLRPAGCEADGPPDCVGTPTPPNGNLPPRIGQDPHSAPRNDAKARQQKSDFLKIGGQLSEVCSGGPCYAGGWTGPP